LKPVFLRKAAKADIAKAAAWYERQSQGLGDKFLDRVDEAIEGIRQNPLGYAVRVDDVRMASLKRFPYGLYFHVEEEGSIVIACLAHRRNPVLALERARGVLEMPDPE
jgi:toxin ParE1/3/4